MPEKLDFSASLARVIRLSLHQSRPSGITQMLRGISEECEAFGCVLWEAAPGSILAPESERRSGTFFALAQWFSGGKIWRQHDIPVASATGHAVANGLTQYVVKDLDSDAFAYRAQFLIENAVRSVCIAPLMFVDGARGSLNIYRSVDQKQFNPIDVTRFLQMAQLLPDLYETIRDEVGYHLTTEVNAKLQTVRIKGESERELRKQLKDALHLICGILQKYLHCFDASVFLRCDQQGYEFELAASTLSGMEEGSRFSTNSTDLMLYPILTKHPLRILDLGTTTIVPVEGKDIILKADEAYINVLMNGAKQGAPLSLMSAPIVGGGEVWGAVRCSAPVDGPTYFADRETKLLELISGQIGHFISDAHHRFALNQANRLYLTIAETVSSLTSLCSEVVSTSGGVRILQDSVSAIHDALRLSRCVTVRWRKGAGTDFDRSNFVSSDTRKACVPLKLPDPWLADLHQGKPFVAQADEPSQSEKLDYLDAIGAADAHVWIAPVRFGDKEMFGYLEIIFETTEPLPEHISKIVDVVARQLGLYHTLAQAISGLRDKEKELQAKADFESDSAESYKRTLMNLEHQIQAPLRHATRRFPMAIRQADSAGDLNLLRQIQFLNGIVRRASKVAANVRFFARLESRQPVELKLMSYRFEDIRKFLIEAARDNELIADSARGVRFDVEKSSFDALPRDGKIALDKNLLDQAVNDLLDNAAKYSFEGQVVKLSARTTKGHFVISIVNRGLRIGPQEVSTVIKRGTRGALAQVDVGEGSGIGLWIVDEIMKAHRGRLEIIPTTSDHLTQIQLFFPLERSL